MLFVSLSKAFWFAYFLFYFISRSQILVTFYLFSGTYMFKLEIHRILIIHQQLLRFWCICSLTIPHVGLICTTLLFCFFKSSFNMSDTFQYQYLNVYYYTSLFVEKIFSYSLLNCFKMICVVTLFASIIRIFHFCCSPGITRHRIYFLWWNGGSGTTNHPGCVNSCHWWWW